MQKINSVCSLASRVLRSDPFSPSVSARMISRNSLVSPDFRPASQCSRIYLQSLRFSSSTKLYKKDWKPDVVYLYQFHRSPVVPNISPFCLKLETWLRANKIKYEVCGTWTRRSKEGKLPFIEFNGEHIADSQLIIFRLQKYFKIDDGFTGEDRGVARAVDRMIEGSAFYALVYFKAVENAKSLLNPKVSGSPAPAFITNLIARRFSDELRVRVRANGMGRHSRDDIINILRKDIQAVDDILGDKKFLLGDRPSIADFTVFGHLAATYFLPFRQPITDMLDDEFPRVKAHIERIRAHYYPEWKY